MSQRLTLASKVKLNSGHELPLLGFGVYQIPKEACPAICQKALEAGYRHIDSASLYRNQGQAASAISASGLPRGDVFFTSKVPFFKAPLGYASTHKLVDAALEQTQLTYLNLMLIHCPYGGPEGRKGAWRALVECVETGKVRSIGVSNYGVHHLDELEAYIKELEAERGPGGGGVLSVGQWELHPWLMRSEITEWCRKRGVAMEAYCSIVRGDRFGEPKLKALAAKHGKTEAQILLRWSLQMGFVPLVKTVTSSRVLENADLFDFELTEEEVADLATDEYSPCSWDPTVETLDK
ncbi:hypothetical protein PWT90_08687 [Aphanocladium album]|nr:hypothetical protein PWT90_08687 [Aphanocladium album]